MTTKTLGDYWDTSLAVRNDIAEKSNDKGAGSETCACVKRSIETNVNVDLSSQKVRF